MLAPPKATEDERVLQLFQNRAELKKSYSSAQDEIHRLRERVKLQEGAITRIKEMMQGLEQRLATPAAGLQVLVHYQLRSLWTAAQQRIDSVVRDMSSRMADAERMAWAAEHNRRGFEAQQQARLSVSDLERSTFELRDKRGKLHQQLAARQSWWRAWSRRRIHKQIETLDVEIRLMEVDLATARAQLEQLEGLAAPEYSGLSLESRRSVNLTAIAAALLVTQKLAPTGLIGPAMDSMFRGEPEEGSTAETEAQLSRMAEIAKAKALVQGLTLSAELRTLSEMLQTQATYRNALDATPDPDSLEAVLQIKGSKEAAAIPHVLRDDLWSLTALLL